MRLLSNQKFLAAVGVFLLSIAAHAAVPVKAQHHHNAKLLVQAKLKQDGHHEIDRKGKHASHRQEAHWTSGGTWQR